MSEYLLSEQFVPFPPCSSMEQVETLELIIFGLVPSLTSFTRAVTLAEQEDGVINPHAFVRKIDGVISRTYGAVIAHIGDLQNE
jgi:hypothetical protein